MEERVDARRLVRPNAFDQCSRGRQRFAKLIVVETRLGETLANNPILLGPVGAPQFGPVDRRGGRFRR